MLEITKVDMKPNRDMTAGEKFILSVELDATVKFDANGGSPSSNKRVVIGNEIGNLPVPVKVFYDFIGWFTLPSGGNKVFANYVVKGVVTLYAQWKLGDNMGPLKKIQSNLLSSLHQTENRVIAIGGYEQVIISSATDDPKWPMTVTNRSGTMNIQTIVQEFGYGKVFFKTTIITGISAFASISVSWTYGGSVVGVKQVLK